MQDRPLFYFFRVLLALFKASKRVSSNFLPLIKITHWITDTYTSSASCAKRSHEKAQKHSFSPFSFERSPSTSHDKKTPFPTTKNARFPRDYSTVFQRKECILSAPIIPYPHRKKRLFSREKQSQKETFLQIFHFLIDFSFLGLI